MDEREARKRFASARVARLATVGSNGRPHLVPVTFALVGSTIWTVVDDVKPKRAMSLQRLRNVQANPAVSVLVDHYEDEDWSALWWVRADGRGRVVSSVLPGEPGTGEAREALCARYPQYAARPPSGPGLAIFVERWVSWEGRAA
jgi:PPOX class probable F420-dependent enzyme